MNEVVRFTKGEKLLLNTVGGNRKMTSMDRQTFRPDKSAVS